MVKRDQRIGCGLAVGSLRGYSDPSSAEGTWGVTKDADLDESDRERIFHCAGLRGEYQMLSEQRYVAEVAWHGSSLL